MRHALAGFCILFLCCGGCKEKPGSGSPASAIACGNESALALSACAETARYRTDLELIAQPRPPGSNHWQTVQDLCADRLTELGYTVQRQAYATGVNVIGRLPGQTLANEEVILAAHYDGTTADCPGADDNGSGLAGLLESARLLARRAYHRTLVIACWDEEERGLLGSEAYAEAADGRGDSINVVFVYETIGYSSEVPDSQRIPDGFVAFWPDAVAQVEANDFRGNFLAVVHDELALGPGVAVAEYARRFGLPAVTMRMTTDMMFIGAFADLRRSDHAPFWDRGIPAMMLTDTADFRNPNYHCRNGIDSIDTLNDAFSGRVIQATVAAAAQALGGDGL